jgi:transposase InsO family protein
VNRFQFVEDHKDTFGVKRLCRVLQVARSSFYRWRNAAAARLARRKSDQELAARIRTIHAGHDGTYGSPRITAELREEGTRINHKRVERVMRAFGIAGLRLRRKVRTTVPEPDATPVPDLLRRNFTAPAPGPGRAGQNVSPAFLVPARGVGIRGTGRPASTITPST